MIAGVLGVSLLAVLGASQLIGHHGGPVPVVQADSRPIRVKPDNPGGLQVAGTNEDIFEGDAGSGSGKLAPPPEAPEPQALRTTMAASAPVHPPAPMAAQPLTAMPGSRPAIQPVPPVAVPAPKAVAVSEKPVEKPAETHPAPVVSDKKALVQLAAFGTEEAAKAEWGRLAKRMPDVLSGHKPAVSKIERDGHTLWRLRTGGFTDVAQATVFCERVRAKGAGCSVADF